MKAVIKTFRIAICLLMIVGISHQANAQQVPLFNQYFSNPFLAYPSTAGMNENPRLSLIYRGQWSDIEGSPVGLAVNYTSRMGKDMGFGLTVQNNEIGLVRQTRISGGVSYAFYSTNKHSLSVGALASVSLFSLNDDLVSPETFEDDVLRNLIGNNGSSISMDFSLSYQFDNNFRIDFAVPTLINESLSDDEYIQINEDNIPDYIAGAQYRFTLSPVSQLYLTPNVTWRYRDVIGSEIDVLFRLDFKEKFSFSGGYRNNYGVTAGVGAKLNQKLEFSYNYDIGQSDVPFLADGFHELGLHFTFKRNEDKWNARYQEGAAVIQRLRNEGIYSKSLIDDEEERLVSDYLYSQETEGSKKERRQKAEERFDEILEEIKENEIAKIAAERERVKAAEEEKARAEQARIAAEQAEHERAEEARRAAEAAAAEAERQAKAEEEKLAKERAAGTAIIKDVSTIGYEYVIVIASYNQDSPYAKAYLEEIKKTYTDAAIFRSEKRGLDYLYVGGYETIEPALARMEEIRANTQFKDSWVHIIRLSR